jgi:hypothetical protein
MSLEFSRAVDQFNWDSEEQKKSYLAFVQYEINLGRVPQEEINAPLAFIFQKQHEQNEYWSEVLGAQIKTLQDEVHRLYQAQGPLTDLLDVTLHTVRSHTNTLELLSDRVLKSNHARRSIGTDSSSGS